MIFGSGQNAAPIRGENSGSNDISMPPEIGQKITMEIPQFGRSISGNGQDAAPIRGENGGGNAGRMPIEIGQERTLEIPQLGGPIE